MSVEVRGEGDRDGEIVRWRSVVLVLVTTVAMLGPVLNEGSASSASITATAAIRVPSLCSVIAHVERLTLTRRALGPSGRQFTFNFAKVMTTDQGGRVRAVARAACSLPDAPRGVRSCPAGFDVSYRAVFALKSERRIPSPVVVIEPTDCAVVTGLGAVRSPTPRFYRVLGSAVGLTNANSETFAGTFRVPG
ncbi:MAG: hypothetical protein HKL86_00795 [Acidimicrobiaceae bacterium]|nr:hypothetical protein [Acidimicrobiaceae bacterium]